MIKITNLRFGYKRRQELFDSLNLELSAGHIYGLLGKNGEGKSTLLKLISGMVWPRSGEVVSLGAKPTRREPSFLAQLYYLPEEIYSPNVTIDAYVKIFAPFYSAFSHVDFDAYIEEFQLERNRKISAMSLGQKKKFSIAFGLACNTRLLIMDEPTNGLDIPSKSQFRRIVARVATTDRIVIISTHQVRDLDNLIDNIIILDQGRIVINNTIEEISERLSFRALTDGEVAIYEESGVINRCGIVANDGGEYSKVDIEMLFNATITNPSGICKTLKTRE